MRILNSQFYAGSQHSHAVVPGLLSEAASELLLLLLLPDRKSGPQIMSMHINDRQLVSPSVRQSVSQADEFVNKSF